MEQQLLSLLSKGGLTCKSWKLIFVVLMRVNPELALTLFWTSLPWWVHNLKNRWSPVVLFVSYLYNKPSPFTKFMYSTLSSIHIMKFRIWTIFVGTHVGAIQHTLQKRELLLHDINEKKLPSQGNLETFLGKTLLLLTCSYTWFVRALFGMRPCNIICLWAFYKRIKILSIWNLPWFFFPMRN